ncbi:hypothetical protein HED60_14085 [Planctomycetales bacterium ZRK34]|nr:hypothetical protein HED60_14085 [Planctomycetales bacterium ZRK34]
MERAFEKKSVGRVPRISRLMALAIHFERLIQDGVVEDFADIARLGHVTRARVTQIMNLRLLAPDIQESLLDLPGTTTGRDPIRERQLRAITAESHWGKQRAMLLKRWKYGGIPRLWRTS